MFANLCVFVLVHVSKGCVFLCICQRVFDNKKKFTSQDTVVSFKLL